MVIPSVVFGRHFLKSKQSEPITSKKTIVFVANDKICVFI